MALGVGMLYVRPNHFYGVRTPATYADRRVWRDANRRSGKGLIALGGDDVPEHRLTDALWSDLDGDFAHDAFTMALHRLRKLLGRREALRLCAGRLGLDRRWCWTDADALDRLELELDSGEVAAEPTSALLSAALDLYRGPFLAADEDDAWTFCRAEHHRQQFVRVVTTCAQRLASADSWQAVLSGCRQAIERESAAEALYQWLMRAALRLDAASEGLAAFGRLRRMLRALEASSPCPESLRLADQLRG